MTSKMTPRVTVNQDELKAAVLISGNVPAGSEYTPYRKAIFMAIDANLVPPTALNVLLKAGRVEKKYEQIMQFRQYQAAIQNAGKNPNDHF